ncbi:MAG: hypothetical protein IK113_00485 [Bacteroidales bacterium]|nr:hypothetical protein [Bacteroidales bacterium]
MRKVLSIILLLGVLTAWSCHKEVEPVGAALGSGSIELRLNSEKAITFQTKATDLEEGLKFNNVLVVLVNNGGKVVAKEYKDEVSPVTDDVISFGSLLPGTYHVYAYANIDATAWQSGSISSQEQGLAIGASFSSFVDRELATLTGTDVPSDPSTSMLLTGHKEIPVGLTRVSETLNLLRPVVRFKVTVRNHTQFPVSVNDLRFGRFNPDKSYLLDHFDESGVPSVPADVSYRAMPSFDTSVGDDNSVAPEAEEVIYQRLMYENAYSGVYKIFATLELDRTSESLANLVLSLGDRPFGPIDYETLSSMDEGEQVDVLVTNPQTSARSGRILCNISSDNNMVWESAGYANYNLFYSRALAIWNEDSDYDYSTYYSYTNANGYSGWDGLNASDGSQATHFNYTGARSRYFHTLTKSNGTYSITGLALQKNNSNDNGKCLTEFSGFEIEKGVSYKKNNSWKNPEDMTNYLVRFKKNTNQYIQCDAIWSETKPDKKTNLKLFANNQANGDRQFALFGKYMSGGKMKRILKDNNKEVPLSYMARNEEINVVLNVYYSDQTGELNFVVDNSTWSTATTSTHTFN